MVNINFLHNLEEDRINKQGDKQTNSWWLSAYDKYLTRGILALMILGAFVLRLSHIDDSRHVAEVQYRSALIARHIYFDLSRNIPEWRIQANANSLQSLAKKELLVREPPITETLTAVVYKFLGREDLRIPRLFASIFWVVGGYFLYKIAKNEVTDEGAIVAIVYFLFIPLGVIVSVSFQADSLMIMMFLISLYAIFKCFENQTWNNLIIAAILSGSAIFDRPLILFALTGAFLGLTFFHNKEIKQLISIKFLVFFIISYIPVIFYYGYHILITRNLIRQAEVSFFPQLLVTKDYWKDWMLTAVNVVGLMPLAMAFIGIPMIRRGPLRAMLIGLVGGYILFCLIFTYHIRYAGYYHTQLIPIVALSFAPIASIIIRNLRQINTKWYWSLFYIPAVSLILIFNIRDINRFFRSFAEIEQKEIAQEIGEIVDHSYSVVYIASYYGWPLEYYAEISGTYWPRSISDIDKTLGRDQILSVEDRLENIGFTPQYFVITSMREYNTYHNDLKNYLINNCDLVKESDQYIIYDSCTPY